MCRRAVWSIMALMLLVAGAAIPAAAHWADQAAAEVIVGERTVRIALTVPSGLLRSADGNGDGRLTDGELEAYLQSRLTVISDAERGTLRLRDGRPTAGGGTAATHYALDLEYAWPLPLRTLTLRYDLFPSGVPTATCLATIVRGERVETVVFSPHRREIVLDANRWGWLRRLAGFVALGVEHIFTGYDHMLFLVSLLILGGSLRGLAKIVSAFTAAHSITLSLAVFNLVSLPGRWVESAIALSIVYVAAQNVLRRDTPPARRWMLPFGFGLVHGLGFATILRELDLPRDALASSLLGFNAGVELGQLVVVAVAYGALQLLASRPWAPALRLWVSASAAVVGTIWFVQRALLG
jgi:hydrogenase/urease accessory protein HupE